jgi:hypothetical protein
MKIIRNQDIMKHKHHIPIRSLTFDINGDILSINHFQTMKNQKRFCNIKNFSDNHHHSISKVHGTKSIWF